MEKTHVTELEVLKREVTRASLQRPYNDQILTSKEMFEFCTSKITGVKYIFVPLEEVEKAEEQLKNNLNYACR